ncbi:hypothetical protein B0H19DRAFT_1068726 [Mycena capillaripes]|nr:hypothetical protein B0H19DRAFT_1086465 [Mycena capillaripes]KAJ6562037.1 hypothetical protein B0H19DRAFT_1068726 [Mycena capillaripes]
MDMDTNGFKLFFEDKSPAHSKFPFIQVGRTLSGINSFFRRSALKSLPDDKGNVGCGVTDSTSALGKKCLGGVENVKPKHAIWLLLVLSFILADTELRMAPADADNDGDKNGEFPTALLPAKRTHSGTVKTQTSDRKRIAAFWDRFKLLWKRKNKKFGTTDLKSEPWTGCVLLPYINTCVAQERALFPNGILALVVGSRGVVAPPALTSVKRLSGRANRSMPNEAGGSRQALVPHMPNGRHNARSSHEHPHQFYQGLFECWLCPTFLKLTVVAGLYLPSHPSIRAMPTVLVTRLARCSSWEMMVLVVGCELYIRASVHRPLPSSASSKWGTSVLGKLDAVVRSLTICLTYEFLHLYVSKL